VSDAKAIANREALIHNLNVALATPLKVDDTITLQARYVVALGHVAKFLQASGASEEIVLKFIGLADAIGQLKNGTVAEVVRPAEAGGRGPDGIVAWTLRAEVVIGLECILRSRKLRWITEAARHIARKYPIFNRLKRDHDDDLETAMLSWRRRIRDGKAPASEEIAAHQEKFFEEHNDPAEMFALGEQLLAEAAERTTKAVF
jgi:hypothetical protein